jgi:hypothetical protein
MSSYYPLPPSGAFTGFIPGGSPYLAGGGYSSGRPAGYPMPHPPHFHRTATTDWLTPSEASFERRHLDNEVELTPDEWAVLGSMGIGAAMLFYLMARIHF